MAVFFSSRSPAYAHFSLPEIPCAAFVASGLVAQSSFFFCDVFERPTETKRYRL